MKTSLYPKSKPTVFPLISVQTTSPGCATCPQLATNRANTITRSLVNLEPRDPSPTSPVPPETRDPQHSSQLNVPLSRPGRAEISGY